MLQDLKGTREGEQAHDRRGKGHEKVDVGVIGRQPTGVASKQSYASNLGVVFSFGVVSLYGGNDGMSYLVDRVAHSTHLP